MSFNSVSHSKSHPPGQAREAGIHLGTLGQLSGSEWLDHSLSPYAAYGAIGSPAPYSAGCPADLATTYPLVQAAIQRPAQNRTALTLSAPIAGSGDLILAARNPSRATNPLAQAKAPTRPARQNVVVRRSWLRTATKSPAFALSSAAINGLMLMSPLVSFAETTTYGTDSSSGTPYTGGIINSGDTVILNDGATVSGATPITADGTLKFNQTTNLTITNVLTGTGSLALINTGNLTLTYNTSVTGPFGPNREEASIANINAFDLGITLAQGSLLVGANGENSLAIGNVSSGSLTIGGGTVQSKDGYLALNSYSTGTANVSTGGAWTTTGDLFIGYAGNGTLTVSGGTVSNVNGVIGAINAYHEPADSDYIPASNGTVTITSGNWTNTGKLTVGGGGTGTLTVSGGNVSSASAWIGYDSMAIISGGNWTNFGDFDVSNQSNSSLTINGGLLTVGGTLTRGASGIINLKEGGTLSIGGGGTNAKLNTNGNFTYNGTLIFNTINTEVNYFSLSGSGSLIKEGSNTLTLAGNNTYTGTTTINAGTLQIGNSAFTGSISSSSNIINNAILDFKSSNNQTYGGQISGSGALNKRQGGTLILSGNNTYTGGTTIHAGTLQIGAGGTSGSLVSNVSSGSLIFNRSDSSTYGGVFSVSTVTKLGAGTLTLTGNNNSGTTTISAGTLQIGAGGTSGSLGSNMVNNANLAFNRSDAISYGGAISGTGNLTQLGVGNLTLSGTNTYNGTTTASAGTLRVQGSIARSSGLTVNSGATLAGNGTITGTTINAGGILAPNNAGSSALAITGGSGTLTLASESISNFSITSLSSDRVTASGSINLDGVLNLAFSGDNYLTSAPYTLFSGESLSGTFSNVSVSGLSSSYLYSLNYAANALNLSLTANVPAGQSINITTTTAATLSGGTILINEPGSSNTSLVLATPTGSATNTIDGNGLTAVLSGPITGTGPLTFTNSQNSTISNTILSGNNTYTGATVVDGGARLSVDGSIASSANLTVNTGAIIGGNGTLPATTIQSGGYLAPGNSIGQLTAASLDFGAVAPGGILDAEIQGPQNDKTSVTPIGASTGSVTNFTGSANLIAFGGGTPWPNFDYQLITATNDFTTSSSLTLTPVGITSALLLQGTTLVQEVDGNAKTFDVMWRPNNGSGATASAMAALGQGNRNQLAAAGVFDSAFRRLASAAGDASGLTTGLNATGTAIGSTGFTTGQAAAAGLSPAFLATTSQLLGISSNSQLSAAISTITPEPYAAFQSVGLETLQRQRQQLLASAGQCASTGWVINAPTSKTAKAPKNPLCLYGQAANANSSITGQDGRSSYNANLFSSFYGL